MRETTAQTLIELYAAKRNLSRNKAENGTDVLCPGASSVCGERFGWVVNHPPNAQTEWCTLVGHAISGASANPAPTRRLGRAAISTSRNR